MRVERREVHVSGLKDSNRENGSGQGQNPAVTVLCVPNSLDSSLLCVTTCRWWCFHLTTCRWKLPAGGCCPQRDVGADLHDHVAHLVLGHVRVERRDVDLSGFDKRLSI